MKNFSKSLRQSKTEPISLTLAIKLWLDTHIKEVVATDSNYNICRMHSGCREVVPYSQVKVMSKSMPSSKWIINKAGEIKTKHKA